MRAAVTQHSVLAPGGAYLHQQDSFMCCRHCFENELSTMYDECWAALPWWSINYLVTKVAWDFMLSLA